MPEWNGWHFVDYTFKCIFSDENFWIAIKIEQKSNLGGNWQVNIPSGNGLAPNRWQAIAWTNDDQAV